MDNKTKSLIKQIEETGIKVVLRNSKNVKLDKLLVDAYYDFSKKQIVAPKKNKNLFMLLVHEYTHSRFTKYKKDYHKEYDKFLMGKITQKNAKKAISNVLNEEYVCEKEAVDYAKKSGVSNKILKKYIREANCILLSYAVSYYTKKFITMKDKSKILSDTEIMNPSSKKFKNIMEATLKANKLI